MSVLFVADIHLSADRPDLISAFTSFVNNQAADCTALYLLGDIFEAWIGDDYVEQAMAPVVSALRALSQSGCDIFLQQGNRDFLLGDDFANSIGASLLSESVVVDLPSSKALIMHGDQLCTDDVDYQAFRSMVRSTQWQQQFLSKPVSERLQVAQHLRNVSKEQSSQKAAEITDVNSQAVIKVMEEAKITLLIHGHTHRPACHSIALANGEGTRMVLGDWGEQLWYIQCTASGCELISQTIHS
ncbi:MAG: UDP-2,3-diacylglucosamine diphosphatase [Oceanospirillaceae bacterium]|nr:UDP-2,3-diacylglucosamine diphosphatase [Oceanospirillaceae bacterium]